MPADIEHLADLLVSHIHGSANFFGGLLAFINLSQAMKSLSHAIDGLADMDWQPDRATLIGDRPRNCLPNPPGGVGAELETALVIEFIGRLHETDIALLDQVQERHAASHV